MAVGRLPALPVWLATLAVIAVSTAAMAQEARTPLPAFTGQGLIVAPDVPARAGYDAVAPAITQVDESSPQAYYIVVVNNAGPGEFATRDYADDLFTAWKAQGQKNGRAFDSERAVLILVAIQNRSISVHPGSLLQLQFGLTSSTIDRELVQPRFIPLAKAGDVPAGLVALVEAVDAWIAQRDVQTRAQRDRAGEVRVQLRQEAAQTRATALGLVAEARRKLAEAATSGLNLDDLSKQVQEAESQLAALDDSRLDAYPRDALQTAQTARRQIEDAIRAGAARAQQQVEASIKVGALPEQVRKVEQAILAARQQGLPVEPLRRQLDAALPGLDAARQALPANPAQALSQVAAVERALASVSSLLADLPKLSERRNALASTLSPQLKDAEAALQKAAASGADVTALSDRFKKTQAAATAAMNPAATDPRQAITTLEATSAQLNEQIARARDAESRHRFRTRTLPLILVAALAAIILLALAIVRMLHLQTRKSVDARLRDFKKQAVEVMDRLDNLKERHKLLPVSDPDFKEPLRGQTLDRYEAVQNDLGSLWDRWLEIMDTLDRARTLIGDQSPLGVSKLKEAEELLDNQALFEDLKARETGLVSALDGLGTAHEQAQAGVDAVAATLEETKRGMDTLATAGLPVDPYRPDHERLAAQLDTIRQDLTPDPIAARGMVDALRPTVDSLATRVKDVVSRMQEATAISGDARKIEERSTEHRKSGLRLDEPGGSPDPLLKRATEAHARALKALKDGDPAAAAAELAASRDALEEARKLMDQVVAARDYARTGLPERRAGIDRVREAARKAEPQQTELTQEFATGSWQAVARNLEDVRSQLARFEDEVKLAEAEIAEPKQHYLQARHRLESLERDQQSALDLVAAVGTSLEGLKSVRAESLDARTRVAETAREVAAFFQANDAVLGDAARDALQKALAAQKDAEAPLGLDRPDWVAVRRSLAAAEEGLKIAREQAETDARDYRELSQRIDEARAQADRVGRMLASEQRDRPAANARFRAAREALDQTLRQAQGSRGPWSRWLGQIKTVLADLQQVETMAAEDLKLADQALAAINEASRALRQAGSFTQMGVSASLGSAQSELKAAEFAYSRQEYEQAIQLAGQARHQARAAYEQASSEADARRRRIEAERRRREATVNPGGVLFDLGPGMAGMAGQIFRDLQQSGGAGGFPFPIPMPGAGKPSGSSRGSGSSSSSWGSGSSQSKW